MRAAVFPVVGPTTICSAFGDPRGGGKVHHGVDICAPMSTPVLAPDDGDVRFGEDPMGGHVALVDADSGGTWYLAHLSAFAGVNRQVSAGEVVGYVGMSGNASTTLPHTHVEAWPTGVYTTYIDPTPILLLARHYKAPPVVASPPMRVGRAVAYAAAILAASALAAYALHPKQVRARRYTARTTRALRA